MAQEFVSIEPTLEERRRILEFIMEAGKSLLENGAEVFRVEQTMQHMARGYHLREFHVFVITNGIFASAGAAEFSELRNIPSRAVHLERVAAINELSRKIATSTIPIAQAEIELVAARNIPNNSTKTRVIASAFGAFAFSFLFGATTIDAMLSLISGGLLGGYLCWCDRRKVTGLFQCLSGAMLVSAVCLLLDALLVPFVVNPSASIIGSIVLLTPGVAFTMAIRDFVHADYLSGTIRLIDAILIAASIAIGVGLVLWVETLLRAGVA